MVDLQSIHGDTLRATPACVLSAPARQAVATISTYGVDPTALSRLVGASGAGRVAASKLWTNGRVGGDDAQSPEDESVPSWAYALGGGLVVIGLVGMAAWALLRVNRSGPSGKGGSPGDGPRDSGRTTTVPPEDIALQKKAVAIAGKLGADLDGQGLTLTSPKGKYKLQLMGNDDASRTSEIATEGLNTEVEAVPVLYHWLRDNFRRNQGASLLTASNVFVDMVHQTSVASYDHAPDTLTNVVDIGTLFSRIAYQLARGPGLFAVESMTAHLGAYWESASQAKECASANRAIAKEVMENMRDALRDETGGMGKALSHYELVRGHSNAARISAHKVAEFDVVARMHEMVLAELSYREAASATNGTDRDAALKMASGRIIYALGGLKKYAEERRAPAAVGEIVSYSTELKEIIDGGKRVGGIAGPLRPIGTMAKGYGPTSVSVIATQAGYRLNHLTPFRAIGA